MALGIFGSLPVVVTTAGTAVPISSSSLIVNQVVIQADPMNCGSVYIGDVDVTNANGLCLTPGQVYTLSGLGSNMKLLTEFDIADTFVNAEEDANKVRVLSYRRKTPVGSPC